MDPETNATSATPPAAEGASLAPSAATPAPAPVASEPEKRGPGRPRKAGRVVSEKQLAKERADESRRANLEIARQRLAAERASGGGSDKPDKKKDDADPRALEDGARMLLRALWLVSGFAARIFGGKLAPLTDADFADGLKESLPLIRRFSLLVKILGFLGFPLWLARMVTERFERRPADAAKPAPLKLAPAPSVNAAEAAAKGAP